MNDTGQRRSDHRRGWLVVLGWSFYDFANSPFTTLVVTFVYSTFFARVIAPEHGDTLWARAVAVSALVIAFLAPPLGALADRGGYRKLILFLLTALCVVSTSMLYWPLEGDIWLALLIFVVANVAFELGHVFYNAFLPDVASGMKVGRVSGYGWALGYLGGLLALSLAFVAFVSPDTPWFGVSRQDHQNIRVTNFLVAGWLALFSLPLFLWVPERAVKAPASAAKLLRSSLRTLGGTLREIRKHRQIMLFLLARLFYNDGLMTIFFLGAIYAQGTFGFSTEEIFTFGIVLNVNAGLGAFALGFLDDYLGGKRTILLSLVALTLASLAAVLTGSKAVFWIAAAVVGIFSGPNQAASRSLMARLVPREKQNEFFGFFAFSGKATSFLGPWLYSVFREAFDSQRAGVAVVVVFFAVGLVLLLPVKEISK